MDGTTFLPQTFEIDIFKETVISKQYPEIVDLRELEGRNDIKLVRFIRGIIKS